MQPEVRNIFNHKDPIAVNTPVLTRSNRSDFATFDPFNETSQACPRAKATARAITGRKARTLVSPPPLAPTIHRAPSWCRWV